MAPAPIKPLRSQWRKRHKGLFSFERFRLYPDHLEIVTYDLWRQAKKRIAIDEIARADLVTRHKKETARLQIKLTNGSKHILRVKHPVLWKKDLNGMLGVAWLEKRSGSRSKPERPDPPPPPSNP